MITAEAGVTQGGGLTLFGESEKCTQQGVTWGIPDHSTVKNLPTMQETQESGVRSLGQEDPLERGMATHSSLLAWKIPWTEEPGGLPSMESQRVGHD